MADRELIAKANLEKALATVGVVCGVEIKRTADGYTVQLSQGSRTFVREGLDEAILEDDWSDGRNRLIEDARRQLTRDDEQEQPIPPTVDKTIGAWVSAQHPASDVKYFSPSCGHICAFSASKCCVCDQRSPACDICRNPP